VRPKFQNYLRGHTPGSPLKKGGPGEGKGGRVGKKGNCKGKDRGDGREGGGGKGRRDRK
jgi:hypothetical protein